MMVTQQKPMRRLGFLDEEGSGLGSSPTTPSMELPTLELKAPSEVAEGRAGGKSKLQLLAERISVIAPLPKPTLPKVQKPKAAPRVRERKGMTQIFD